MSEPGKDWLDNPRNVTRLVWALAAVGVGFMVADLFYEKHVHFRWEEWFGGYGFFGFAAFFFIVMVGKRLRRVLMRPEDYYDE